MMGLEGGRGNLVVCWKPIDSWCQVRFTSPSDVLISITHDGAGQWTQWYAELCDSYL